MILGADGLASTPGNSRKVAGIVTRFTIGTVVTSVRIAVAFAASIAANAELQVHGHSRGHLAFPLRQTERCVLRGTRLVTEGASHLAMRPVANESRHPIVAELRSLLECDSVVALLAVLTHFTLMLVVLLMAVEATLLAKLVVAVDVTRHTRNGLVLAFERVGLVVEVLAARCIEVQERRVALLAILTQLPIVLVAVAGAAAELARAIDAPWVA